MTPDQVRQILREELSSLLASDRYTFQKHLQLFDGRNIQVGKTTGTQIGTEATQKLGFFGATPVAQHTALSSPGTGGADSDGNARIAIIAIQSLLHSYGLSA